MILAALLGGAAGADRTAVGQTLLAHPAVAATLAGFLMGAPAEGIWLGFCLSLLSHSNLPIGYESLRDTTSVAVAIPLALGPHATSWAWGAALVLGLLLARPAGQAIHALRALTLHNRVQLRRRVESGEVPRFEFFHFGMAFLHFLRGLLVCLVLATVLRLLLRGLGSVVDASARQALEMSWWGAPLLGVGGLLRQRARLSWVVLGLGLASLWLLVGGIS